MIEIIRAQYKALITAAICTHREQLAYRLVWRGSREIRRARSLA